MAKNYKWTLQFGNDKRLTASSAFPTAGKRQLLQQSQLDNAVLRNMNTSSGLSSAAITQGLRGFPLISSTKINFPVSGLIGRVLFPFGVSFLLPIFIVVLVKEKEDRILIMMKMNGMKSRNYMISQYITFYCLFLLSTAIFLIAGSRAKMELFTLTDPGLLIIVFLVWGHAQNAMAFFASNLFNKNSLALSE